MRQKEYGFIRITLLIITVVLILSISGVSVRDQVNNFEFQEAVQQVSSRAENTYINHLEQPVERFVVEPADISWKYTKEYGVDVIADFLSSLLERNKSRS